MARVLDVKLASEKPGEDLVRSFTILFDSAPVYNNAWSPLFLRVFHRLETIVEPDFDFYITEGTAMFKVIIPHLSVEKFLQVVDLLSVLLDDWAIDWNPRS